MNLRNFRWHLAERAIFWRGLAAIFVFCFVLLGLHILHAQPIPAQSEPPASGNVVQGAPTVIYIPESPFFTGTTRDPWFWVVIGMMAFSAFVSGEPEPDHDSPNWYVWFYRSSHILMQMGTSYFADKAQWINRARLAATSDHFSEVPTKPASK